MGQSLLGKEGCMEYLGILLFVFLVFMFLKLRYDIQLFKSAKERMTFVIACLVIGIAWDSYAILRGHWSFGEPFFIRIKIGVMPVEEYLFMLIIPFSVLVLYKIVTEK
ncbi:MAG: lycopene cyclase domain-containing protein [Candidatus Bathyarchaeia archaeon]